jgi:hypothetical protein
VLLLKPFVVSPVLWWWRRCIAMKKRLTFRKKRWAMPMEIS